MLSAFFTRLTNLFRGTAGGLPQQNPNMVSTEHLRRAEELTFQQAERDEYVYVCTDRMEEAFRVGQRLGYPPSKVYYVRDCFAVAGIRNVRCVMASGWSLVVSRTGGAILTHMQANGWELVDEAGGVIKPTWDGCHVRT